MWHLAPANHVAQTSATLYTVSRNAPSNQRFQLPCRQPWRSEVVRRYCGGFHFDADRHRKLMRLRAQRVRRRHEDRNISADRNVDPQRFCAALVGEVIGQAFAQLPRIVADDVVLERAIARSPVKDLDANLMFGDLFLAAFEGLRNNKQQKLRQQGRPGKVGSRLRPVPRDSSADHSETNAATNPGGVDVFGSCWIALERAMTIISERAARNPSICLSQQRLPDSDQHAMNPGRISGSTRPVYRYFTKCGNSSRISRLKPPDIPRVYTLSHAV